MGAVTPRSGGSQESAPAVGLREVDPEAWQVWRDVRLRALADSPAAFGASLSDWELADEGRWRQRLEAVPFNVVAVVGGVTVGQVSGTDVDEDGRVELISMWVAPDARGTGAARALVEAVVGWAERVGATAVRLSVRRDNQVAIRFYRGCGFRDLGEPGDEPAELAMTRPVGS